MKNFVSTNGTLRKIVNKERLLIFSNNFEFFNIYFNLFLVHLSYILVYLISKKIIVLCP